MSKKKIGVIGLKGLPAYGGAATVGENIIKRLSDDFEFVVYAISSHSNKNYQCHGFRQHIFKALPFRTINVFLYYLRSALHALLFAKYDLIHLHHIDGAFMLPLLRLKYKVISTSHARTFESGKWPSFINKILRFNESIFLKLSNSITSVGLPLKEKYENMVNKKIYHIPNGIDLTAMHADIVPPFQDYLLFSAGRIIPLKGLHLLLNVLRRINYKEKICVVGDINQIPTYKNEIFKLSKSLNIEFLGLLRQKEHLFSYVKYAKLFVFPSLSETMSIMLLEVAAMNVLVICSDIKENLAVFNSNEVLFFKSGDEQDLKEKILWAIDHYDSMKNKAKLAYKKLKEDYNWDNITEQYKELYNLLLA